MKRGEKIRWPQLKPRREQSCYFQHMCAAKTNTKVPRNSKRQAGGCLLRPGLVNFARLAVKSAGNLLFLRLLAFKRRFPLRRCACWCATSTDAGGCGCPGARIAGAFAFFGASAQVQRLHFSQCAHGGDSSGRRGRAFTPPTWVCGRKRRGSPRSQEADINTLFLGKRGVK